MNQATIIYLLSEEGRKKSLLAGGDGKELQKITTDITPQLLELAHVDTNGNIALEVGVNILNVYQYQVETSVSMQIHNDGQPYWHRTSDKKYFDEPQTAESLIAWEQQRVDKTTKVRAAHQAEFNRLESEYNKKREAERQKADAERKAQIEADRAKSEAKQAQIEAEKQRREAEKLAWVQEHGSDYLQRAVKLNYNCQKQYITERAALELPDYIVDFKDRCRWNDRSCPSLPALEEVEKLIEAGYTAEVVWLTNDSTLPTPDDDEYDEYDDRRITPCEAIMVRYYLGKYDLYRII